MKIEWQKGPPRLAWHRRREAGESNLAGILIIVFIIIVAIMNGRDGAGGANNQTTGTTVTSSGFSFGGSSGSYTSSASRREAGTRSVIIGTGNASYSYQPYEEYITLDNVSRGPVNITGWQLKNGKDQRPYYTGSSLQRFSADVALIPQATLILSPSGQSLNQDVILQENEKAIVTTGSFGVRHPYTITSFKENMCTGYLEALPDYAFNPSLSQNCPDPEREPGLENLDIECRKIVERISPCETPEIGERDPQTREFCPNCYEGKILSSLCQAYIEEHFSYKGCLAYHQGDPNFSGRTWRLFLGRGWEMWAEEYESIELFDRFGQLVNYQNY